MSPTLTTVTWIILASSFCLSVNSNSGKPGSHHLPPVYYSISLYMYINIRVVNQYLHGTQPYQLGYSDYVPVCLPLCCLHTPHISKDTQVSTFSPILSLRQLHLFVTQLDSPVSLHYFLGFLHLLNDFNISIH